MVSARLLGIGCVLALLTLDAWAQPDRITASVDRATVRANESMTYLLRAEGPFRAEPDFTAIEREFDVLDRSRSTRVQIVNGQAYQVGEWQLQLMPRAEGRYTLAPATLEGVASNAVEVEVLPAQSGPAAGDIFLETEVLPERVYVQAQLVFTLRIFRGVSTGRASLTAPVISGGEAIIEPLGEDREYQTVRDGRSFIVRERRFAVFPQQAGRYTVEPMTFEAVVVASSGFSSVQRFSSEPVHFEVLAAVAPPPQWTGADWLPASRLVLSEHWSEDPSRVNVGEPLTRTIIIEADGILETQLPELVPVSGAGLRQYADQPELTREIVDAGRIRARRVERLAVIARESGSLLLPAVELPWWNVEQQRWEVARVEPRTIESAPIAEPGVSEPTPAPLPEAVVRTNLWPWIALGLGAAWLMTVLAWWRSAHRSPPVRRPEAPALSRRSQNRRLLRQLAEVEAAGVATKARDLLLEWGRLRFEDDPPLGLGALAARLPAPAAAQVRALEASLYGPEPGPWHGAGLAAAMRAIEAVEPPRDGTEPLLPLYR